MTAEAGIRWVESWLLPHLASQKLDAPLRCLKLEPAGTDETAARAEAARLGEEGHSCTLALRDQAGQVRALDGSTSGGTTADDALPWPEGAFDLVLCGGFGRLAPPGAPRARLAAEMARIVRPGGHLLLHTGNRFCPVDFSGNAGALHLPGDRRLLTLTEAEALFVGSERFAALALLSPAGYQSWARLPALARPLGALVDGFWSRVALPRRRWLYASPLNPSLVLWLRR